jgi:hypothetical protein
VVSFIHKRKDGFPMKKILLTCLTVVFGMFFVSVAFAANTQSQVVAKAEKTGVVNIEVTQSGNTEALQAANDAIHTTNFAMAALVTNDTLEMTASQFAELTATSHTITESLAAVQKSEGTADAHLLVAMPANTLVALIAPYSGSGLQVRV